MASELEVIKARLDMLEAQQAITVAFVRFLVEALIAEQPEEHHAMLRSSLDRIFENTIANFLASNDHTDFSVHAVELMRTVMFGKPSGTPSAGK